MRVDGILLAQLDVSAEYTEEYNRWYDFDHMPEHVSKRDVLLGLRYVAPQSLRRSEVILRPDGLADYAPYASIYLLGGQLDFAGAEALGGWNEMNYRTVKAGRYWRAGTRAYSARWRLAAGTARASVLVSQDAIPYLPHTGILIAKGHAPSAEERASAVEWWDQVHLVDLLSVPGVQAALRFDPIDGFGAPEEILHVMLCDLPMDDVMAAVGKKLKYLRALTRYPAYGGIYSADEFLAYQRIVPFNYDFDIG